MGAQTWTLSRGRIGAFVEATGVLKAFAHDRWFYAPAPAVSVTVDLDAETLDVPLDVTVPSISFEPVADDLSERERQQLLDNLRGHKVLDVGRHPEIRWRGRYVGTLTTGTLQGMVELRGQTFPLNFDVTIAMSDDTATTHALWAGKLTDLGIAPFKALLGAIRLKNTLKVEIEATFQRQS